MKVTHKWNRTGERFVLKDYSTVHSSNVNGIGNDVSIEGDFNEWWD